MRGTQHPQSDFSCQLRVESRLCGGRRGPGPHRGMDTHVKEGQLYVQHQKFGKVRGWESVCLLVALVENETDEDAVTATHTRALSGTFKECFRA